MPFSEDVRFTGFIFHLATRRVSVPLPKKEKYLAAIDEWLSKPTHTLDDVRGLYGKLLHTCLVQPSGRAYLTGLETMLGLYHNSPFKPLTPPRIVRGDLCWWRQLLQKPDLSRALPGPHELLDLSAFSDASSTVGIGITIGDRWRAWRLLPGWKSDDRDIGWAEALGFEFLIRTLIASGATRSHIKVFGDNKGVVEGWWTGRSRNHPTNDIFKRLHIVLSDADLTVHSRYVPSKANPADGPSRGIFPPESRLLPAICIPPEVQCFVVDFDTNFTAAELCLQRAGRAPTALPKPPQLEHPDYSELERELEFAGLSILAEENRWERYHWEH